MILVQTADPSARPRSCLSRVRQKRPSVSQASKKGRRPPARATQRSVDNVYAVDRRGPASGEQNRDGRRRIRIRIHPGQSDGERS
jgi:hypothetical protein